MLSTVRDNSFVTKWSRTASDGQDILKPLVVEEYNRHMGGVDTGDQLQSYYGFSHRTVKWWRRLFFHLIDLAIVNAYILYLMSPRSGKRLTHAQVRIELAKQLLMDTVTSRGDCSSVDSNPPSSHLTGRHFQGKLGVSAAGRQIQPDCVVCIQQHMNANSIICLCVLYLVLNCTIQRRIQSVICRLHPSDSYIRSSVIYILYDIDMFASLFLPALSLSFATPPPPPPPQYLSPPSVSVTPHPLL